MSAEKCTYVVLRSERLGGRKIRAIVRKTNGSSGYKLQPMILSRGTEGVVSGWRNDATKHFIPDSDIVFQE